jgi:hypothetical protein
MQTVLKALGITKYKNSSASKVDFGIGGRIGLENLSI